jgi:hypothetical protein
MIVAEQLQHDQTRGAALLSAHRLPFVALLSRRSRDAHGLLARSPRLRRAAGPLPCLLCLPPQLHARGNEAGPRMGADPQRVALREVQSRATCRSPRSSNATDREHDAPMARPLGEPAPRRCRRVPAVRGGRSGAGASPPTRSPVESGDGGAERGRDELAGWPTATQELR